MFEGIESLRDRADGGEAEACIRLGDLLLERAPYTSPRWESDGTLKGLLSNLGAFEIRATDAFEYSGAMYRATGDAERVRKNYFGCECSVMSSRIDVEARKEELARQTPARNDYLRAAAHYFRQAAAMGDPAAMYRLGWRYRLGQGVEHDREEGLRWWRRAAKHGDELAEHMLLYGEP